MKCPPSSIFVDMHARHNRGHAIFLSRQPLIILHSKLLCLPFEISRSLKTFKTSTNQYLVSNEYFYMVNPCCDVTKTTVKEIKNLSNVGGHLITSSENISRTKRSHCVKGNNRFGGVFRYLLSPRTVIGLQLVKCVIHSLSVYQKLYMRETTQKKLANMLAKHKCKKGIAI